MKKIISLAVVIFTMTFFLQGCYTILDLPEISNDEYVSTPVAEIPIVEPLPCPDPNPIPPIYDPAIVNPIIIIQPIVTISNPAPNNERSGDIQKLRNDGNGRGNSGRNSEFINNTKTGAGTNSGTTSNSSSNITRGSSDPDNSGNRRR